MNIRSAESLVKEMVIPANTEFYQYGPFHDAEGLFCIAVDMLGNYLGVMETHYPGFSKLTRVETDHFGTLSEERINLADAYCGKAQEDTKDILEEVLDYLRLNIAKALRRNSGDSK